MSPQATSIQEELIEQTLQAILNTEGGYVNNPADPGKATNFGITIGTLQRVRGPGVVVTAADVLALTLKEARAILREHYIERPGLLAIKHSFLFWFVVDGAVNHGPQQAIKLLQKAVGAVEDGVLGPKTIAKLDAIKVEVAARLAVGARMRWYGTHISHSRRDADHDGMTDAAEFAGGWADRMADFVEHLP